MNYKVVRTETADAQIRKIILYVAENFGREVALEKLEELERNLLDLGKYPQKCVELRYLVLKRQGYKVLVLEKNLRFLYKGIIIKHNKTEPTYTKTSLFLCEKRRFFMARTEKGVVATI